MEFLRHLVGWVSGSWCGFTLPPRDGALPAGVRGSGRGPSTAAVAVRVVTSVGACGPHAASSAPAPHVFLLIKSSHPRSEVSAVRPSSQGAEGSTKGHWLVHCLKDVSRELTPNARACALHRAGLCLMWPIPYFYYISLNTSSAEYFNLFAFPSCFWTWILCVCVHVW